MRNHARRFAWRATLALLPCAAAFVAVAAGCHQRSPTAPATTIGTLDAAYAQARLEPNLKSLVVARDGSILRAEYFNGGSPDNPEHVWSVTKSVLALTVGAALDTGCLTSLDQTLGQMLGPLVTDPAKAPVTLRQLLTMSSGIDFPEAAFYASGPSLYDAWLQAPDQVAFVMTRPMTAEPGTRFEYGSGTIHLVSVALTRACGLSISAFADQHLFGPLGIPARRWDMDRQGYNDGGSGLWLAPSDMLAIGAMVLDNGRYRGRQVVGPSWVQAMTRTQIGTAAGSPTPAYGYGWWVGQTMAGDAFALANGWGGQFIFVLPAKRVVVTAACAATQVNGQAALNQWQRIFQIIYSQILPSF